MDDPASKAELAASLDAAHRRLRAIEAERQTRRDHSVQILQSDARLASLGEALAALAGAHAAEQRMHAELSVKIARLEAELAERDALIRALLGSRSWRLTAPLRYLQRAVVRWKVRS